MAQHNNLGKKGEDLAIALLKQNGCKISAINCRFQRLEIDIVAETNDEIIFVEVKSRGTSYFGNPEEFISRGQQKRIIEAEQLVFSMIGHPESNRMLGNYLEKNGYPKTLKDLDKHKFITYGKGAPSPVYNPDWALKLGMHDGKKRKTVMKVNSVMGLLLAVESGVGLAALPEYLVSNSNNVIKVLPKSEGPITEAHFVYPQSLKNTARVQAFRNFLFSKIGDWK